MTGDNMDFSEDNTDWIEKFRNRNTPEGIAYTYGGMVITTEQMLKMGEIVGDKMARHMLEYYALDDWDITYFEFIERVMESTIKLNKKRHSEEGWMFRKPEVSHKFSWVNEYLHYDIIYPFKISNVYDEWMLNDKWVLLVDRPKEELAEWYKNKQTDEKKIAEILYEYKELGYDNNIIPLLKMISEYYRGKPDYTKWHGILKYLR